MAPRNCKYVLSQIYFRISLLSDVEMKMSIQQMVSVRAIQKHKISLGNASGSTCKHQADVQVAKYHHISLDIISS